MLGDFENESVLNTLNFKGIENWWKVSLKLDINNGTDDLRDFTNSSDLSGEVSYLIQNVRQC
jgi:hypothetical protein